MIVDRNSYQIFKTGSVTFFTANLFFPGEVRTDVFYLYAFVRKFDDFVDKIPQQTEQYFAWKADYHQSLVVGTSENSVIQNFINIQKKYNFPQEWIEAFFKAMEQDLDGAEYKTIQDTEEYMYGSAEVIGLMMAKIMKLEPESFQYAQLLGKAFQYMNFIRDISEDIDLKRFYIPEDVRSKFGIGEMSVLNSEKNPKAYKQMIRSEISRYRQWMAEARTGFHYIPKRYRIPIESASDMFDYVINEIEANPLIVFKKKLTPSRLRVLRNVAYNALT